MFQVVFVRKRLPTLCAVTLPLFLKLAEIWLLSGLLVLAYVCAITPWNIEAFSTQYAYVFVVYPHLVASDVFVETRLLVE